MKAVLSLIALLLAISTASAKEKVLVYVVADEVLEGSNTNATAEDLEDSANDLRKQIKKRKELELAGDEGRADIVFHVVDRWIQSEPDAEGRRGYALRYHLVAGTYQQDEDYVFGKLSTGGGMKPRIRDLDAEPVMETPLPGEGRSLSGEVTGSWGELAESLSRTLQGFAIANYDRIMALRTEK